MFEVLSLWSSIFPVSRQCAAPSCSPTLHHHRNLRSICTVALSFHPSAHHPERRVITNVQTNDTQAKGCVRRKRTQTEKEHRPIMHLHEKCERVCWRSHAHADLIQKQSVCVLGAAAVVLYHIRYGTRALQPIKHLHFPPVEICCLNTLITPN